jgi:outer membrane lipoprotein-sorting protein
LRAARRAAYNETMPFRRPALSTLVLCLICALSSGCIARRRLMKREANSKPLQIANQASLLAIVQKQYDAIQNFSATVDMVPALGSTEKNHITEYKDVSAFIRFRKPSDFRLIGLVPLVHTKMFDMVSNGATFKLYIPSKGRFIVGRNEVDQPSPNKLENLRPEHFLDALIVRPVDTKTNKVLFENFTDEDNAYYIVQEVRELLNGDLRLLRQIWFSRIDMSMARQIIFDDAGNILTDARYSEWHAFDNLPFPKHIEINRPRDEYAMVLDIVKMDINKGVSADQFILEQPEGTTLQNVGGPASKGPQK